MSYQKFYAIVFLKEKTKSTFFLKSIGKEGLFWRLDSTWRNSEPLQWAVQIYKAASSRHPGPHWVLVGSILLFSSCWEHAKGRQAGCFCKGADGEDWMLLGLLQVNVCPLQFCRRIWVCRSFMHFKVSFLISQSNSGFSLIRAQRIHSQICTYFCCLVACAVTTAAGCSSRPGSAGKVRGCTWKLCIRRSICIAMNDCVWLVLNIISKETASTEGQRDNYHSKHYKLVQAWDHTHTRKSIESFRFRRETAYFFSEGQTPYHPEQRL